MFLTSQPHCPNHLVELTDCNFKDGQGICPISGAIFEFDFDQAEKTRKLALNSLGRMVEVFDWQVSGDD